MTGDQFGDQSQSEPCAVGLGCYERLEQTLADVIGYARAVVLHPNFDWSTAQRLPLGGANFDAVPVGRVDRDFPAAIAFVMVRVAYLACYLANLATLRSLVWMVGMGLNVWLFLIAAKAAS